jgi:hypothetical protein
MISENKLFAPIKNYSPSLITSKYNEIRKNGQHKGLDLGVQSGTEILSPADGIIKNSQITQGDCGGLIEITHADNITTRYCHLKKLNVKQGQNVKAGQLLGLSGGDENDPGRGETTGAHLHFEVLVGTQFVDPETYLLGQSAIYTGNTSNNSYNLSNNGGTSLSSKGYMLGQGNTNMSKAAYQMYNPNAQATIPESVKNDVKNIKNYYKKLNIPILLESELFKPSTLTEIGDKVVSSFRKKSNSDFSDNYTYQPIGSEFRCEFNKCETRKRGNCYITEIYFDNTTHYIHVCSGNFELKNQSARKNDIIANIKSNDDHYSVTVTKGLSTRVALVSNRGEGGKEKEKEKEKKPYKFTWGGTDMSSNKYDTFGKGSTDMSSNSYGKFGKGSTDMSSNSYGKFGKGSTDMSSNSYGKFGKGSTSMSNEAYTFDGIKINEDVIDEINRIRKIL